MQVSGPASTTSDAKRLVAAHKCPRWQSSTSISNARWPAIFIVELHEKGCPRHRHFRIRDPADLKKAAVILQKPFSAEDLLTALRTVVVRQAASH